MRAIIALTAIVGAAHLVRLGLRLAELLCCEIQAELSQAVVIGSRIVRSWRRLLEDLRAGALDDHSNPAHAEEWGQSPSNHVAENSGESETTEMDGRHSS